MTYIHQIVTQGNRDVTTVETIYTNCDKPKFSMKGCLSFMKNVQYEIVNRINNQITIVGVSK
jgi:hypothetical protein